MKELSIEQKAKAYDEAIKRAKVFKEHLLEINDKGYADEMDYIFPELQESEDERIRKSLIDMLKNDEKCYLKEIAWLEKQGEKKETLCDKCKKTQPSHSCQDITALGRCALEKQGEQKHTAEEVLIKAGLKPYKDGDQWCVLLGDNIQEGICGFGNTIEDALYAFLKDLIASQGEQKPTKISNICEFSIETWIKIVDYVLTEHNGIGNYLISPEVKDTAEKLQKKYKFDAASEEWDRVYRKGLDAGVNKGRAEALREQKPTEWSEEDELNLSEALHHIRMYNLANKADKLDKWLKDLKDRVLPQPKQEWSEEDIATISRVISIVKWAAYSDHSHPILNDEGATELVERLKSLKERYTWKPSDAQMVVLNDIIINGHLSNANERILKGLQEQLKKLREE